jgi:hypothetical protein
VSLKGRLEGRKKRERWRGGTHHQVEDVPVAVPEAVDAGLDALASCRGEKAVSMSLHPSDQYAASISFPSFPPPSLSPSLPPSPSPFVFHPATKPPTEGPASNRVTSYSSELRW